MMTCKDCLHVEVCAYIKPDLPICSDFADRSRFFAYVVSFACGLFVGAVAMYTWGDDDEYE